MAEAVAPVRGRFMAFLRSQLVQIHQGGPVVVWRKARRVLPALPFLPLVLLARAVRPLVTIRFGSLRSYRIGDFAINTEVYLCQRDLTNNKSRILDIFYLAGPVSNQQLKKMWSRTLRISRFARYADVYNNLLPGSKNHIVPLSESYDWEGNFEEIEMHLSFTVEEEEQGWRGLKQLGLPVDTPFVCLHARDPGYLEYALPSKDPDMWRYHDHRDSDINTFLPAAEQLADRGYFLFRTGVAVKEALNTNNPRIIDYAMDGRTDFLDIFLSAKCHFFICDTAGISSVPMIFRRPIAWLNHLPLDVAPSWSSKDLFIPKNLWSTDSRRFLTFREILSSDIGLFGKDEQYVQLGIEAVDNTPEEISSLVLEMEQRLAGMWRTTEEDEELQARFWALFPPHYPNRVFRSRIGAEFLRQHRELLD